jgi:alkanesulfonate monooxygenase SsuD/methylene tetrahydromethanopterin reductase-like flavin-dependent oxidoreductase (luciferase family)
MKLGALLPLTDIGGDPGAVREFTQQAEAIGYDFIEAPDHVLGVNAASRPGWDRNTSQDLFHDPFVLFGYLAGVTAATRPRSGSRSGSRSAPAAKPIGAGKPNSGTGPAPRT